MSLSIAQRLNVLVVSTFVALLAVGLTGVLAIRSLDGSLRSVTEDSLPSIQALGRMQLHFMQIRVSLYQHMQNASQDGYSVIEKRIDASKEALQNDFAEYEKYLNDANDAAMLKDTKALYASYENVLNSVLSSSREDEKLNAQLRTNNLLVPAAQALIQAIDMQVEYNDRMASSNKGKAESAARYAVVFALIAMVVGVVFVCVLGWFLKRGIIRALDSMEQTTQRIGTSLDFTLRMKVLQHDEIGRTAQAFNGLLDKIQGSLRTLSEGAVKLADSSLAMSQTATQVARASHEQSEAASHMAATIEEISTSISHVGDRADEANRIVNESGELAGVGERVIGQTIGDIHAIAGNVGVASERIQDLETQSQQISTVVAAIKEVADQTNLLALNAAIEAARAGEMGRGFAVVADEVRKLAERTAESTVEISGSMENMRNSAALVVQSMTQTEGLVTGGVQRAGAANDSIQQIGQGSRLVVSVVGEISSAIHEQASATHAIASHVEKIAQMSEESSAAAEESARTAHELDKLAEDMKNELAAYCL